MIYLSIFIAFLSVLFGIIYFQYKRKNKEKDLLEKTWSQIRIRYRNYYLINQFKPNDEESNSYCLTEQVLTDIDIEELFSFVDRTETTIGQQYLFSKLSKPSISESELKLRGLWADFFIKNVEIRKKVQVILYELEKSGTDQIADFFYPDKIISFSKYKKYLNLLTLLAILSVSLCWTYPLVVFLMLFLFGLNLMIHLIFRYRNSNKLKAIRQVYKLIKVVDKLQGIKMPINPDNISSAKENFWKFKKVYHFLDFGIPLNDISSIVFYVFDLIKSFFLIEIHLLNFSYNEIIKNKEALKAFYIFIGKTEMALSIASLKTDNTLINSRPYFVEETNSLIFEDIVHPLIEHCAPNSLSLYKKSAFITGSNMSGKSTFLRAILINSVLAQSLYLVFATIYKTPILKTFSSIKISDNLQEGKSFYFEEVNIIHEMIVNSNAELKNLFIIDEIFKGTNTVERIALSKAILQNLCKSGNIVIASSHDIELIELLNEEFELYHFAESINSNRLYFDHKIKIGPLKTRNAIKIVEMEGFPSAIIEDAKSLAQDFLFLKWSNKNGKN